MRKTLSMIIALVVAFSAIFVPVYAEDDTATDATTITVSSYDEFKSALANASADETVVLVADITITEQTDLKYSSAGASFSIDLNGHTLTFTPSSDSVTYAIFINYFWKFTVSNSSATEGGFVNNSNVNFFKTNGASGLYMTGTFYGNISNSAGIKFEDCTVYGDIVSGGNVEISSGKYLTVNGSLTSSGVLTMKDATAKLYVSGKTVVSKNATIYADSYFGSDVAIGEDYTQSATTTIYGGTFKGAFSAGNNVILQSSTAKYLVNINDGSFYGKVTLCNPNVANLGTVSATINNGVFYQNAIINSSNLTIYRGSFSYTFLDENSIILKTATVRLGSKIYPPTVPKKVIHLQAGVTILMV